MCVHEDMQVETHPHGRQTRMLTNVESDESHGHVQTDGHSLNGSFFLRAMCLNS